MLNLMIKRSLVKRLSPSIGKTYIGLRSPIGFHQFQNYSTTSKPDQDEITYQQIKKIYQSPNLNPLQKSNQVMSIFKEINLQHIMDPRYQSILGQIKKDVTVPNDTIFELNQVFEMYHQNKQHNDDYQFEMMPNKYAKKTVVIFGHQLSKQQIIMAYFGSMSTLLIGVTIYGISNLNIIGFTGIFAIVLWISFTFNPF